MTVRTKTNLKTAIQSGALQAAKYRPFAACVRMQGEWDLSKVFEDAAENDRTQHFNQEPELANLIASSPDNLRKAIETEGKAMNMFAQFENEAIEDGDANAAALFNRISRDKAESYNRLQAILASLQQKHANC